LTIINFCLTGKSKRYLTLDNMNVCILSSEDSHQSLVNAAKYFSTQEKDIDQQDISLYLRSKSSNITQFQWIIKHKLIFALKENYDFPDPELLINFGPSLTLNGFPLWQIRLTEIYFLPTHHNIKFNQFYDLLFAYSKSEQRFGK
jgi:undecaprenyl pyrophosphate synthase